MSNISNKLKSYIEYITYENNKKKIQNIEFEIRFGKYGKISSNLNINIFREIIFFCKTLKKSSIKYSYINDILYKSSQYRKRIVIVDDIINKLFDKINNTEVSVNDLNDIIKQISNKSSITKYIKKEKIFNDRSNIFNNVKIDLVNELSYDTISTTLSPIANRHKFRCSIYNDIWIYDLTILLYIDEKTKKCNIFYEVEMELNIEKIKNKSNSFNIIYDSAVLNINSITNVINCIDSDNNIEREILNNVHNSVVTLEQKNIQYLKNAKYAICDKADGERKFIYTDNCNMFHINPSEDLIEKKLIRKMKKSEITKIKYCLLDGEMVETSDNNFIFYGFDILFYNNADCRSYNLVKRLELLNTCISTINNDKDKNDTQTKETYKFNIKKFYLGDITNKAEYLWNNKKKMFPYNLDGLIFTPINSSYIGYLPILKWKDKHSIDIRIFYNKNDDFTEFYSHGRPIIKQDKFNVNKMVTINEYKTNKGIFYKNKVLINGNDKPIQKFKDLQLINRNGILGMRGKLYDKNGVQLNNMEDIIEVEFLYNEKKWIYLRKRDDKNSPNAYLSILSVLNAVVDNITTKTIKSIRYEESIYEKIGMLNKNCFTDIGFNFIKSSSNINKFYSQCLTQMLNLYDSNILENILILGCNKQILCGLYKYLCDIKDKIIKSKKKINIIILENNCLEVFGNVNSEGYVGLYVCYEFLKNKLKQLNIDKNINIQIIWTDVNIYQTIHGKNKNIGLYIENLQNPIIKKIQLSDIYLKKYNIIYINNLEYTYFNKKECVMNNNIDENIANIKKMLHVDGILIGLFLSDTEINKELTNKKCIVLNNGDMHPLYKLHNKNNNISGNIQLVQIKRSQNNFFNEYQPLITDKFIIESFKKNNFKKINCNTLMSLYSNFNKIDNITLSEYDLVISNITKYIIFK